MAKCIQFISESTCSWCVLLFLLVNVVANMETKEYQILNRGPVHGKHVVCYVATWAVYRPDGGKYALENIDPSLCTHLVYSFAGLDANNNIVSLDPWQDLEKDYGKAGYKRMVALKEQYPHLTVTIAIGGWNQGSLKYSQMAADPEMRKKFISSVLLFLDLHKFDGLDLDWEYPARREGRPQDKANYVLLVKELKEAFEPHGYILTAALGAGKETMEAAYDLAKLSRYLDLIHMMCYDYHGTWDGVVGPNAPLRGQSEADVLSIEFTINYMLSHGVSPYKLVLGLPMYGRTFVLKDPNTKVIEFGKSSVRNEGFKGPYTREAGFMGYNEICKELISDSSKWIQHWHNQSETPYIRDGERVICYDNARSISAKVKMAMDYNLGGLMVWSIDTDDFDGNCGVPSDAFEDFVQRHDDIVSDKLQHAIMRKAMKNLADDIHPHPHMKHYEIVDGKVLLRLPRRTKTNYGLMRTINEATSLAVEEKRIADEMEKLSNDNNIDTGAGIVAKGSVLGVILCLSFGVFLY